jgi:hypothetical protein
MIGIDLVKPDGRNGQFLHTLDNAMDDLRAQIESLRLPKIEMETKLGRSPPWTGTQSLQYVVRSISCARGP